MSDMEDKQAEALDEDGLAADEIDASAEKLFFIEMLVKDIGLLPAIVDLVDNSVDGARSLSSDHKNLNDQWIKINIADDQFLITDNSGGISLDVARHYAFRFGRPRSFTGVAHSVGQFGVGMKRAIFKIGKQFSVSSSYRSRDGVIRNSFELSVDVESWAVEEGWTFRFDKFDANAAVETAGTSISVTNLHRSVNDDLNEEATLQALRTELSLRHQESIKAGLEITVNGRPLRAVIPVLQANHLFKPIVKQRTFSLTDGEVQMNLYAGTVLPRDKSAFVDEGQAEYFQDEGSAGWYLFCNGRLLMVADRSAMTGWGSTGAAYHPQYRQFRGYVFLSAENPSLLPWNTTKTAVDRNAEVFGSVQSEIKRTLVEVQSVINRAKTERSRMQDNDEATDLVKALQTAEEVTLEDLTPSAVVVVPPAPPVVKQRLNIQRIQYAVSKELYEEVATALGASSGSDVGRRTFDYFYAAELD